MKTHTLHSVFSKLGTVCLIAVSTMVLALMLTACSTSSQSDGSGAPGSAKAQTADATAMDTISKGLVARWELNDKHEAEGEGEGAKLANLKEAVQAEIDADATLRDATFEDQKLQEKVVSYLNALDDHIEAMDGASADVLAYTSTAGKIYNKRCELLKSFVDDYGLSVPEKHQDKLDEFTANGKAVQAKAKIEDELASVLSAATFEKEQKEYSNYFEYSAVLENTTGHDLKNVSITLALYDADGVRMKEVSAYSNTWTAGEKARFTGSGDFDAASVKAEMQYYDLADK